MRVLCRLWLLVLCVTPACAGANGDSRGESVSAGTAAPDARCDGFTQAEIARALGTAVALQPRRNEADMCVWDGTTDEEAGVQTHMIRNREAWTPPRGAKGYEALAEIGEAAYVVPELGGWAAAALIADGMMAVWITGSNASREAAIQLLRTAIERQ
jgi:hypothetical protein